MLAQGHGIDDEEVHPTDARTPDKKKGTVLPGWLDLPPISSQLVNNGLDQLYCISLIEFHQLASNMHRDMRFFKAWRLHVLFAGGRDMEDGAGMVDPSVSFRATEYGHSPFPILYPFASTSRRFKPRRTWTSSKLP